MNVTSTLPSPTSGSGALDLQTTLFDPVVGSVSGASSPRLLNRAEAALFLGITPKTLQRWIKSGKFPPPANQHHRGRSTLYWPLAVILAEYRRRCEPDA